MTRGVRFDHDDLKDLLKRKIASARRRSLGDDPDDDFWLGFITACEVIMDDLDYVAEQCEERVGAC